MNIVNLEKPVGVITSLGGQTAVNLAEPLEKRGVRIIGPGSGARLAKAAMKSCV